MEALKIIWEIWLTFWGFFGIAIGIALFLAFLPWSIIVLFLILAMKD